MGAGEAETVKEALAPSAMPLPPAMLISGSGGPVRLSFMVNLACDENGGRLTPPPEPVMVIVPGLTVTDSSCESRSSRGVNVRRALKPKSSSSVLSVNVRMLVA